MLFVCAAGNSSLYLSTIDPTAFVDRFKFFVTPLKLFSDTLKRISIPWFILSQYLVST